MTHLAVVWIDHGDPLQVRVTHIPCGALAADVEWSVSRELVTCEACVAEDPGPRVTWRPHYGRTYYWPRGTRTGPGALFKPDGKGGGLLIRRGCRAIWKRARGASPD